MYVCETHLTAQQPEPNFSLLVTLTVFVAGDTNSPMYKHRPEVTFGPGACARSNRQYTFSKCSEINILGPSSWCYLYLNILGNVFVIYNVLITTRKHFFNVLRILKINVQITYFERK